MKPAKLFLACAAFLALALPVLTVVLSYQNVCDKDLSSESLLSEDTIRSLSFNQGTIFPRFNIHFADQVLENGKNPGLGVRSIHQFGLTGQGVNVAIIDQNLSIGRYPYSVHPEFDGKLINYTDIGTGFPRETGSLHGPAVLSLLVGETIGTAPGARVYYVAVPSWKNDAAYYAAALNQITAASINQNLNIRVVSISATPSTFSNPLDYERAVEDAEDAGILVLDCGEDRQLDIYHCYYDVDYPEIVSHCTPAQPGIAMTHTCGAKQIHAPNGYRTLAEQYDTGVFHYRYEGRGGLSWSIPYVAGVLALGWELKPNYSGPKMVNLLLKSAYKKNGCNIIDPWAFINLVKSVRSEDEQPGPND